MSLTILVNQLYYIGKQQETTMLDSKEKCYYVSSNRLHESKAMTMYQALRFADRLEKQGHKDVFFYKGQLAI